MMKLSTNKEARGIYRRYLDSNERSVFECYRTRPSIYKEQAENSIIAEMNDLDGYGYKVISHSGFVFTCGYLVRIEDKEVLVYHTKTRREEILIDTDITA